MITVKELIQSTIDLFKTGKWNKFKYFNADTECYCLDGGLRISAGGIQVRNQVYIPLDLNKSIAYFKAVDLISLHPQVTAINGYSDDSAQDIIQLWNDHYDTTRDDVISVLEDIHSTL